MQKETVIIGREDHTRQFSTIFDFIVFYVLLYSPSLDEGENRLDS